MRRVLLLFALPLSLFAQSAQTRQKLLDAEAAKLKAWGTDRAVVAFVKNQNAAGVPPAQIKARDVAWSAGKATGLVKQVTSGPCADYLKKLARANSAYGETFLMDNQGALVCATQLTSDYWQGDEAKWQRAFADGKGAVFIDRPRYDESAKQNLAQISVPVMENDRAIGVITVGVSLAQ